jgi:hypothetical protein
MRRLSTKVLRGLMNDTANQYKIEFPGELFGVSVSSLFDCIFVFSGRLHS